MQPTLVHAPPSAGLPSAPRHSSTQAVFSPSCAARIAATYPPGPPPITTTSNVWAMIRLHPSLKHATGHCPPYSFDSRKTRTQRIEPLERGRIAFESLV